MFQCWDQWLVFVTFNPLKNKCKPKHLGWKTPNDSHHFHPQKQTPTERIEISRNIIGSCNDPAVLKRPPMLFLLSRWRFRVQPKIQVHVFFLKKLGPPKVVFWDGKLCGGKGDKSYPLGYSSRDASCARETSSRPWRLHIFQASFLENPVS